MNMHGVHLSLSPNFKPFNLTSLFPQNQPFLPSFSIPSCRFGYAGRLTSNFLDRPSIPFTPIYRNLNKRRGNYQKILVRANRRESPCEVLGVSPSATPSEIKMAFKKLALKYHPDINKKHDAQDQFMKIKHAYEVLTFDSRKKYDAGNRASETDNYKPAEEVKKKQQKQTEKTTKPAEPVPGKNQQKRTVKITKTAEGVPGKNEQKRTEKITKTAEEAVPKKKAKQTVKKAKAAENVQKKEVKITANLWRDVHISIEFGEFFEYTTTNMPYIEDETKRRYEKPATSCKITSRNKGDGGKLKKNKDENEGALVKLKKKNKDETEGAIVKLKRL